MEFSRLQNVCRVSKQTMGVVDMNDETKPKKGFIKKIINIFEEIFNPKIVIIVSIGFNAYFTYFLNSIINPMLHLILLCTAGTIALKQVGLSAFQVGSKDEFIKDNRIDTFFFVLAVGAAIAQSVYLWNEGYFWRMNWEYWYAVLYTIYVSWADFDVSSQGGSEKLEERSVMRR